MSSSNPKYQYRKPINVVLACTREEVNEEDVDILDLSEDPMGRDVLTFRCPVCAEYHKSYRIG